MQPKDENNGYFREDYEHIKNCEQILAEAVEEANIASVIFVLQKDLVYWAVSLKRHMFRLFNDYKTNWHHFPQKALSL